MPLLTEEQGTIRLEEVLQWADFRHLSCCPEQVNYRRGENIYSPRDPTKQIYRIHRGKVRLSYLDESGRRLQRHFMEDPKLTLGILQLLGRREQKLLEKLFRLHFHSVPRRIAEELLELADKWGKLCAEGITIHITHQELAYLIGASRETTSVALSRLNQQGLLRPGHHQSLIVIVDPHGLREVAEGHHRVSV